jgi:hypothetical protein
LRRTPFSHGCPQSHPCPDRLHFPERFHATSPKPYTGPTEMRRDGEAMGSVPYFLHFLLLSPSVFHQSPHPFRQHPHQSSNTADVTAFRECAATEEASSCVGSLLRLPLHPWTPTSGTDSSIRLLRAWSLGSGIVYGSNDSGLGAVERMIGRKGAMGPESAAEHLGSEKVSTLESPKFQDSSFKAPRRTRTRTRTRTHEPSQQPTVLLPIEYEYRPAG